MSTQALLSFKLTGCVKEKKKSYQGRLHCRSNNWDTYYIAIIATELYCRLNSMYFGWKFNQNFLEMALYVL